ncbi:MAG: hypothetical protein M3328_11015, partial [Chloroflexota bacterium]|nr:hypothetical protein [Chloroflexota bacterium]
RSSRRGTPRPRAAASSWQSVKCSGVTPSKAAEIYLTTVYLWGLSFRPARQYLRLGPDSIVVLVAYAIGVAGLVAIAGGG